MADAGTMGAAGNRSPQPAGAGAGAGAPGMVGMPMMAGMPVMPGAMGAMDPSAAAAFMGMVGALPPLPGGRKMWVGGGAMGQGHGRVTMGWPWGPLTAAATFMGMVGALSSLFMREEGGGV